MRNTLIRRFTTETQKLRRKDTDGDDPDERFVPVDEPAAAAAESITDPSQHPQEERAAPWQEDLGILELMRLAQRLFSIESLLDYLLAAFIPQHPGQRSSFGFHPVTATLYDRLYPFISSCLNNPPQPPSPYSDHPP